MKDDNKVIGQFYYAFVKLHSLYPLVSRHLARSRIDSLVCCPQMSPPGPAPRCLMSVSHPGDSDPGVRRIPDTRHSRSQSSESDIRRLLHGDLQQPAVGVQRGARTCSRGAAACSSCIHWTHPAAGGFHGPAEICMKTDTAGDRSATQSQSSCKHRHKRHKSHESLVDRSNYLLVSFLCSIETEVHALCMFGLGLNA